MKKVALLFGIDDYPQNSLKNAANDASALSEKLTELGFESSCHLNVTRQEMNNQIIVFKEALLSADVGLFFFAGHGVQCKGENFLTSIDTSFADESSCKYTATPLNFVIEVFEESKINTKIIVLDACRDNPFTNAWRGGQTVGLAPVYAPKGTLIAYSTSPGQKAADGIANQGVYTGALLTHIATKRLTIENMFKRVRHTVSSQTHNQQITWEHTSLMGDFFFNSGYDDGQFVATYSKTALADAEYAFEKENELFNIVTDLKSYNWYTQNQAISRISHLDLSQFEIDELFVLGRNIYQTACGTASNAVIWIENIENNLSSLPNNVAFHLLNGVLFEIYFDSFGNLRNCLKTDFYEYPVKLCLKESYKNSCLFIRKLLEQYSQRIIYLPGTTEVLCVDVVVKPYDEKDKYYVDSICVDGMGCMYVENETELYNYEDHHYLYEINIKHFNKKIYQTLAIPENKVRISYSLELDRDANIISPHNFKLDRYRV